jgi:PAP2 superfamily
LKTLYFSIFFNLLLVINGFGQKDTNRTPDLKYNFLKANIIPLSLLTTGIVMSSFPDFKKSLQQRIPNTNTNLDDYLVFVPMAEIYLADLAGIDHQNSVFDQTKYLLMSQLFSNIIVFAVGRSLNVERPNGNDYSFPSGHTNGAFVGATALYHEFKQSNKWVAYSGYLFATATGALRVTNNNHWVPDVLAGAGIGMLVTNLVYHFKPLKNWQPFKTNSKYSFIPGFNYANRQVSLNIIF